MEIPCLLHLGASGCSLTRSIAGDGLCLHIPMVSGRGGGDDDGEGGKEEGEGEGEEEGEPELLIAGEAKDGLREWLEGVVLKIC